MPLHSSLGDKSRLQLKKKKKKRKEKEKEKRKKEEEKRKEKKIPQCIELHFSFFLIFPSFPMIRFFFFFFFRLTQTSCEPGSGAHWLLFTYIQDSSEKNIEQRLLASSLTGG